MGNRIEWAELGDSRAGQSVLISPEEVNDDHGNTNERFALGFEGICIEGDLNQFRAFAAALGFEACVRDDSMGVYSPLSERERVVFALTARGYTAKRVAAELSVSRKTVECQIRSIYEKTGATCRDELIDYYWGDLNR